MKYELVFLRKPKIGDLDDIQEGDWIDFYDATHAHQTLEVEKVNSKTVTTKPLKTDYGVICKSRQIKLDWIVEVRRPLEDASNCE